MVKGIKSERKIKEKERGVRIQAIIGRVQMPDPDLGHFGPDFDSRSGLESAFTDQGRGAALMHGLFGLFADFYRLFTDLQDSPDSILYRENMPRCVCEEGGNLRSSKSGLKEEKLLCRPHYFFQTALKFLHE